MFGWIPRWLRAVFGALILGLVVWALVIPQFGRAEDALDAVVGVHVGFVVLGTLLVVGAVTAQAELTRSVLPRQERPTLAEMSRMELATMAVSHTVPGGTAAGTALAYRLLTQAGVSGSSAGFALGIRGIGSAVVLNALLWAALMVSIPAEGFDPRYTTAALLGVVLFGLVGAATIGLLRAQEATTRAITTFLRRLPLVDHERAPEVIDGLARQLRDLIGDRRLAVRAAGWSAAYWLALASALWVLLHAFGWTGHPISVLVAFGLVNVLAALPVTPRGLGVLEAVLIPMLVGFGAPAHIATLGVVGWRLLSFWAPIPLGTLSYVSLRLVQPSVGHDERPERGRPALAEELAEARSERESLRDWAERHALAGPDGLPRHRRRIPGGVRWPGPVVVVVLVLVARNLAGPVMPDAAYVPVSVVLAGGLLLFARRAGASWHTLGLDRGRVGAGLWTGALVGAAAIVVMAAIAAVPLTRGLFDDGRVSVAAGTGELLHQALLRIPLGTVLFEELAFRGVLLGLLRPHLSWPRAIGASSALFGLWHILPTLSAASTNGISGAGAAALVVGAVGVTALGGVLFCLLRTRSGHLLASVLAPLAINDAAYVLAWIVRS